MALALHLLGIAFPWRRSPEAGERVTHAKLVTLALYAPRPSPKPTHTPAPPRPTPAPHYTLAPVVVVRAPAPKAAATPRRRTGGAAARKHPKSSHAARPAQYSLAAGSRAGVQNGGTGTGAGAGNGDGGQGGTGTGTSGSGNGNGGDANTAPCGDIYLLPGALSYRKDGTVLQQVLAKIVERDGTVAVDRFPYPFVYAADKLDPFRHDEAVTSPDGGIPVQLPPAGMDVASMPASVQIILKYTNPQTGTTTLPACNPDATPH